MTIGTRIILENRKPLNTLLPLEAPLVLFIDPSDACNSKCSFCPTSNHELMKEVKRPLKQMSFGLFSKIINDLEEFETKVKVIRLYGHGEPLLNKDFCDMVFCAKKSSKVETVDTTTNGILLTNPYLRSKLIDSGIDRINISVNGLSDEQYLTYAGINLDFKNYVEGIKQFYKNKKDTTYLFIKINGDTISKEDEQKFLEIFEPITDSIAIEKSMNCWNNFEPKGFIRKEENIGIYGQAINKSVDICPYLFYSMMINSNGEVSNCFLDWNLKMVIEDVKYSSVKQIWNGHTLKEMRKLMLYGHRKVHPICSKCEQLLKGMPENLDPYRKELINKYNY